MSNIPTLVSETDKSLVQKEVAAELAKLQFITFAKECLSLGEKPRGISPAKNASGWLEETFDVFIQEIADISIAEIKNGQKNLEKHLVDSQTAIGNKIHHLCVLLEKIHKALN